MNFSQSFPELVHEKVAKVNPIPKGRQRRYVNAQEYMSADDVPKYLVNMDYDQFHPGSGIFTYLYTYQTNRYT